MRLAKPILAVVPFGIWAAAATAQEIARDTTFALQLLRVDSVCETVTNCAAPILEEGDSDLIFSSPGDRYLIGLSNGSSDPMHMSLLVMTGAAPQGQIAWPKLVAPGQTAVLPDTLLVDARLGTDLLIVLAHDRYFSPNDFRRIEPDKYRSRAGWDVEALLEMLRRNEARIHIARLYYHTTRQRSRQGLRSGPSEMGPQRRRTPYARSARPLPRHSREVRTC
jgi:hypothetical protein